MKARQSVLWMPVAKLRRHPANVREDVGDVEELARSIAEHGILQPLVLTEDPGERDAFRIIAGHRRLAAACKAGMISVPVVVRHGLGGDDVEQVVVMLVENCQRRDLSPMEKANAYGSLANRGLSQSDIARRTGTHVSTVNHYLALLDLDDDTQADVAEGSVNVGDAVAAVRQARQEQRKAQGTPPRGRPTIVEKPYLGKQHRLAPVVRLRCEHSTRFKVGGVGCGQCWEQVILEDAANPGGIDLEVPPAYDEAAVKRRLDGDHNVATSKADREETIRRAHALGLSDGQIADRIGLTDRTVLRTRQSLGLTANFPATNPTGDTAEREAS